MSAIASAHNSNSKSNLIEVEHVGVTAKFESPLKNLMLSYSSSTESENNQNPRCAYHGSQTKYNKFVGDTASATDSTITNSTKALYEMKSVPKIGKHKSNTKMAPSKIEFQLYAKPKKCLQKKNKRSNAKGNKKTETQTNNSEEKSILQRLKCSLNKMKHSKKEALPETNKIFADLREADVLQVNSRQTRIGIYPFEYGCSDYLETHDCPPQILSLILAEKATLYATRFWAEFFGSLQIGITFIVAFLLQSYRFLLYSFINILLVEFLHMTSDYLVKPLLTVTFNGFLQPPLIFCFNILSSIRDILKPIAETVDNFMKPVATVGRSIRLIHATYNKRNCAQNV